jgi:hypothetical protein
MKRREMLTGLGTAALFACGNAQGAEPAAAGKSVTAAKPQATVLPTLSVDDLKTLLFVDSVNPTEVYGRRFDFTGEIIRIGKGVDGGTVPQVRIDGWDKRSELYGTAFVHNVIPDFIGKTGDRAKIEGIIVEHGYGTLFVWCGHWVRVD